MWDSEKQLVLETKKKLIVKGLVVGNAGNVSMRIAGLNGKEMLVITPSQIYCESLSPDDMVIVDFNGDKIEGKYKPSMETMLHIEVYKKRKDAGAIIHAHPQYSSVLAVTGRGIPEILDDQIICLGGEIKVAGYAPAGSSQLVENVVQTLGDKNAVIMANHGSLTVGKNMAEALTNCEILEKTAKIFVHAFSLGEVNSINGDGGRGGPVVENDI